MNTPESDILLRLLFILHRGWVETRLLASGQNFQQIFDLADALEIIPPALSHWTEGDLETIRVSLETYSRKYPNSTFNYADYLEKLQPPDF